MMKNQKGITILLAIFAILAVSTASYAGYIVLVKQRNNTNKTSSASLSESANQKKPQVKEEAKADPNTDESWYLVIDELGIKLPLTENTKDAYYIVSKRSSDKPPVVKLSVHSLDNYSNCKAEDSGIAGIATFVPGQNDPVYGDFDKAFPDAKNYDGLSYFVSASQYDCTLGKATELYGAARGDFVKAYSGILKINE